VEALQEQQGDLIKSLGVKSVYLEGLTDKSKAHYAERIETLKRFSPPTGDDPTSIFIARLRREDTLQLGAPGKLLIAGELDAVHPSDDAELHALANPVQGSQLRFDASANEAREAGIVKLLLNSKLAVVVLGGEHDLANNLPPNVEYIRVTLTAYQKAGERR
jgi:hypothetical protein